jgi:hypothetical protein
MLKRHDFLAVAVIFPLAALANDGFYQGSGSELKPITHQSLHVLSENLKINFIDPNVCYPVIYKGKGLEYEQKHAIDESKIKLGSKTPCPTGKDSLTLSSHLRTMWHAEASYHIRADEKVTDIQFGFPVPQWEASYVVNDDSAAEGLHEVKLPAVAGFKTWVDGQEVKKLDLKSLVISPRNSKKTQGYTWLMSFDKGREYDLKSTYDFGVGYSADYFEGAQYPKGHRPWFLPEDKPGNSSEKKKNRWLEAVSLIYYLTPLKSWGAPPPTSVQIEIHFPKAIPVEFAVPIALNPACIDNELWTFEMKNTVPSQELKVSLPWMRYPQTTSDLPKLHTWAEWQTWVSTFKNGVRITCGVRDRILKNMAREDMPALQAFQCVQSCFEK